MSSENTTKMGYKGMKNIILRLLMVSSIVTLTACGGGGGGDTVDVTAGSELKIYAESSQSNNVTVSVTGTWITACYQEGTNPYQKDIVTISATGVFTYTKRAYTTGDTTCTGSTITDTIYFPTTPGIDATLSVDVEPLTLTGWRDGTKSDVAAPQRADSTGSLSANPKISRLDLTEGSAVQNTEFYLDDTSTTHVLYRESSQDQADQHYMSTADPFYKQ